MPAFLVDEQLPLSLAKRLRQHGVDAHHVSECGLAGATDDEVAGYAQDRNMAIVTKDEDFVTQSKLGRLRPCVVWVRVGNAGNAALWDYLWPLWPGVLQDIESGENVVEVS